MTTNEWYTPSRYVEAVREVMEDIDLDPASCEFANRIIKAKHYYTVDDNGLNKSWFGRCFVNPPYGKTKRGGSNLAAFVRHLVKQYKQGNVTEAILLIPVNTATSWFPQLWDYPICFPKKRIRFYTEKGLSDGASFPTLFAYFGPNPQKFIGVFSKFGRIASGIDIPKPTPVVLDLWEEVTS